MTICMNHIHLPDSINQCNMTYCSYEIEQTLCKELHEMIILPKDQIKALLNSQA